jgi:GTP:adenosylcobinamide-phosphate guanylyltransferase
MDAILTAGGTPRPGDYLYEITQGGPKALIDIHGKPMIQWVLDALDRAETIGSVALVGLPETARLTCSKPVYRVADQGEMLANIRAGARELQAHRPDIEAALVVASDMPALTPEIVDWLARLVEKTSEDVYYNVIVRDVMEKRYPESRRTYTRLKDMVVCGADINAVRIKAVLAPHPEVEKIIANRKNPLKQAAVVGFDTLALLVLGQLSLEAAVKRVAKRLGLTARATICPWAEAGMDVDKAFQLDIMRRDLGPAAPR